MVTGVDDVEGPDTVGVGEDGRTTPRDASRTMGRRSPVE
jgi:hypothetical protein